MGDRARQRKERMGRPKEKKRKEKRKSWVKREKREERVNCGPKFGPQSGTSRGVLHVLFSFSFFLSSLGPYF